MVQLNDFSVVYELQFICMYIVSCTIMWLVTYTIYIRIVNW